MTEKVKEREREGERRIIESGTELEREGQRLREADQGRKKNMYEHISE